MVIVAVPAVALSWKYRKFALVIEAVPAVDVLRKVIYPLFRMMASAAELALWN